MYCFRIPEQASSKFLPSFLLMVVTEEQQLLTRYTQKVTNVDRAFEDKVDRTVELHREYIDKAKQNIKEAQARQLED